MSNVNRMKPVCCCFFLLLEAVRASAQTECTVTDGGTLKCKFSENINSTQRDFSVYFDPDHGDEEQLVACTWIKSKLHCITQKDFKREEPASKTTIITIPKKFLSRNGSYRCVIDGYRFNSTPCWVPARQDLERDYEANSTSDDSSALPLELTAIICVPLTVLVLVPVVVLLKRKKGKEEKKGKRCFLKSLLAKTDIENLKNIQDDSP